MEGHLHVHAEFLDGRPAMDEKIPSNFAPGQERNACLQLLMAIQQTGGILHLEDNAIELTALQGVKSLRITAPAIVGANLGDMPKAGLIKS